MGDNEPEGPELVLPYPYTGSRIGQYLFLVVGFVVLMGGPVIAIYAWLQVSKDHSVSWVVLVWFGGLGLALSLLFIRLMRRMIAIGKRTRAGAGWLHLSPRGFELHQRTGSVRRYRWNEIDSFMYVECTNDENGVNEYVGFRFSPEHTRSRADKLRMLTSTHHDRDGGKPDGVIDGYWTGPIDEAVALMNEWRARYVGTESVRKGPTV